MAATVTVSRQIDAPPRAVWELVSDVTRMGEWSPETRGCRWLDDATGPAVGARFRGRNSYRGRRWATTCTVTDCEAGSVFAFDVDFAGVPVARWEYRFEPVDSGCEVRETFSDRRARLFAFLGNVALGITDRGEHNRRTMDETLRRLAEAAEG